MKRTAELPFRFFGPVTEGQAETLAYLMLNNGEMLKKSDPIMDTLIKFLKGDIEPRELAFEIQVIAENAEEYLRNNSDDAA